MWLLLFLWLVYAKTVVYKRDIAPFNYTTQADQIQIICIDDHQCVGSNTNNCYSHPVSRNYQLSVDIYTKAEDTILVHASSGYLFWLLIELDIYPSPHVMLLKPDRYFISSMVTGFTNYFFPFRWDVDRYYTVFNSLGLNCVYAEGLDKDDKIVIKYKYKTQVKLVLEIIFNILAFGFFMFSFFHCICCGPAPKPVQQVQESEESDLEESEDDKSK